MGTAAVQQGATAGSGELAASGRGADDGRRSPGPHSGAAEFDGGLDLPAGELSEEVDDLPWSPDRVDQAGGAAPGAADGGAAVTGGGRGAADATADGGLPLRTAPGVAGATVTFGGGLGLDHIGLASAGSHVSLSESDTEAAAPGGSSSRVELVAELL